MPAGTLRRHELVILLTLHTRSSNCVDSTYPNPKALTPRHRQLNQLIMLRTLWDVKAVSAHLEQEMQKEEKNIAVCVGASHTEEHAYLRSVGPARMDAVALQTDLALTLTLTLTLPPKTPNHNPEPIRMSL